MRIFYSILLVVPVTSATAQDIDPRETVFTLHGVCSPLQELAASGQEGCSTVLSRQDFDKLMTVAAPNVPPTAEARQRLARAYAELAGLADAARKLGFTESAEFQQTIGLLRLRTLANMYRKALEADAKNVSEAEVDAYYRSHSLEFEEVKLRRLVIPKADLAGNDRQEYEKKALELAREIRDRAVQGEDLEALQKDAYAAIGLSAIPPSTIVGNRRRSQLTLESAEDVFALATGDVSKVENEQYSFVVYKVDGKLTLPKQQVKEEIIRNVTKAKIEAGVRAATGVRADLNEEYFGATALTQ